MKEIVDRILNGEAVDIAGDGAEYYLSVSKYEDKYNVGFVSPDYVEEYFTCLDTETMKEAGSRLIKLAEELESRKKFRVGDRFFFIDETGVIRDVRFGGATFDYAVLLAGNAFKTREEAEAHKDEIMTKYQDLSNRGLV